MTLVTIPHSERLRRDIRSEGFCSFRGRDLIFNFDCSSDRRQLETALDEGGTADSTRRRYLGRYLLGPNWTPEMLDLGAGSHAFLTSDYRQGADINPEQGGRLRSYAPIPDRLRNNCIIKSLIFLDINLLPFDDFWINARRNPLLVGVHLIRMVAQPDQPSLPSPSVPHQDGEPFTCIHLINRSCALGGSSQIYRNRPVDGVSRAGELVFETTLEDWLDSVIIWDRPIFHHVTPVVTADAISPAHRDVLIIDFTPLEECKFNSRGEVGIVESGFDVTLASNFARAGS